MGWWVSVFLMTNEHHGTARNFDGMDRDWRSGNDEDQFFEELVALGGLAKGWCVSRLLEVPIFVLSYMYFCLPSGFM